jgi:hypothetical protein
MLSHTRHLALPRVGVGRLLACVLLPVLLLLAQQGLLLHELRHVAQAERQEGSIKKDAAGLCKVCLALSQVQASARPHVAPLPLMAGLSFGWAREAAESVCAASAPDPHNRGPPVFL